MITKWKLFNFKCIQEETELALKPLTILAGSNSSGKSTVLQSMLLISQTLSSTVRSRSVVLNGPLVKMGQFDDLRSYDGEANQILIGWECEPRMEFFRLTPKLVRDSDLLAYYDAGMDLKTVACELSFEADPSDPWRELLQLQPQLFGSTLEAELDTPLNTGRVRLSVSRAQKDSLSKAAEYQIEDVPSELLSMLEYDVDLEVPLEQVPWNNLGSVEPVGCDMDHFLPNHLAVRYDSVERSAKLITATLTDTFSRENEINVLRYGELVIPAFVISVIQAILEEPLASRMFDRTQLSLLLDNDFTLEEFNQRILQLEGKDRQLLRNQLSHRALLEEAIQQAMAYDLEKKYELTQIPLTGEYDSATRYLKHFFSSQVKYLGPLRDEPKSLYSLASNVDPADIGYRGEHTASVFDLHKTNFVNYIRSRVFRKPDIKFDTNHPEDIATTRTLETAVFDWLRYMGVAESMVTRDLGKLGHELKVTTAGTEKPHDLTHVGVGVSQVLPILVMCLLAEPDTTIIIEQPELHLHPKVQTLLGDFFLSMALLGKQIIVETHSEYIINRLRYRAAAAKDDRIANQLKIYFAEKKGGASHFREVNVNEYGAIMDWPEGFFDQSQSEAEEILRAATRKRKLARKRMRYAKRND